MRVFDILGPIMVGPSSSHTAGAVKIGYIAGKLLKEKPMSAEIYLHGSFQSTGIGHGTDKALIAGLLGMQPDDERIPDSLSLAAKVGLQFTFSAKTMKEAHPNTVLLCLTGESGRTTKIQASSIGGGRVLINKLDDINVDFSAEKPTLLVHNQDKPGYVAEVTLLLSLHAVNIATMKLHRDKRNGHAVMVIETDQTIPQQVLHDLEETDGICRVCYVELC